MECAADSGALRAAGGLIPISTSVVQQNAATPF